jgi:hypothetical protein
VKRRVAWWPAIGLGLLTLALFVGEQRLPLPPTGHQTAQVAILLSALGLITMWLKLQDPAFQQEEIERHRLTFHAPDRPSSAIPEAPVFPPEKTELAEGLPPGPPAEALGSLETGRIESVFHHSLN